MTHTNYGENQNHSVSYSNQRPVAVCQNFVKTLAVCQPEPEDFQCNFGYLWLYAEDWSKRLPDDKAACTPLGPEKQFCYETHPINKNETLKSRIFPEQVCANAKSHDYKAVSGSTSTYAIVFEQHMEAISNKYKTIQTHPNLSKPFFKSSQTWTILFKSKPNIYKHILTYPHQTNL